jgi:uncharacterized protein
MSDFPKEPRNQVRRMAKRGQYDRETIYAIVDEALLCQVAFVDDSAEGGQPFVIPTIHARRGDTIILHGAKASRLLKHLQAGNPVCITMTLLDGLVLARSVFHSSMNYRSVVLFGTGHTLESEAEKMAALEVLTEHLARGRWADARRPTPQELAATTVIEVEIESASAKVRTGPAGDDEEDYALPIWAGVVPLQQQALAPINDPRLLDGIELPAYAATYRR